MAKRNAKDFDVKEPQRSGLDIVDPVGAALVEAGKPIDREYPKHLVQFEGGPGTARLVQVAQNAADEKKLRAQGYGTHHELDDEERKAQAAAEGKAARPKAAKPKAAKAPRNPKPKAAPKGEAATQ